MLDELRTSQQSPSATVISIGLHAAVITAMLIPFAAHMNVRFAPPKAWFIPGPPVTQPPLNFLQQISGAKSGGGGQHEALRAGRGNMRFTAMPVMPIRRVTNPEAVLQMPPAVPGPEMEIRVNDRLGVPWSKLDHDSLGKGGPEGVGDGDGRTAGDRIGDGFAPNDHKGNPGYLQPSCQYCPNPSFTDEAIRVKYSGVVTLRVLVGADGRVELIQLSKGAGMGLDERALETVRTWRFRPGRIHGAAVRSTILVEVQFRQF